MINRAAAATASRAILVVTLDSDSCGSPGATVMREPGRTAHSQGPRSSEDRAAAF
jgi:hypothetical protein